MLAKRYVRIMFVFCFLIFIMNKFSFRPWVNENSDSDLLLTIVYSLPNFIEAVMGVLLLSGILTYLRDGRGIFPRLRERAIYFSAGVIAAVYVFSQELGFHNIGGNNVYDLYDMIASLMGLLFSVGILLRFGLTVKPNDG